MLRIRRHHSLLALAAAAFVASAVAQNAEPPQRWRPLADVVKDMQATPGLLTLYRFDPNDKNRDPERLLAQIPRNLLDEDMLFATSISSGGVLTGFMWDDYLVRWRVAGNFLMLITPDTRAIEAEDEPIGDVVRRTYAPTFLAAVPIETMTPNGDVVIDLNRLLKTDIADVGMLGGMVRPELSTWGAVKNYPDNILIEADLALAGGRGGRTVGVSFAFRRLPKPGAYKPREADQRVGYFVTTRVDWSKPAGQIDIHDRYIQRWKLEKLDPSLDLSPPKEPIVFIIEDTVPIKWRRWVRAGIEDWNKAFEKIGVDQAIVVQQQTKDNEYANCDPEDVRYNFFRWIVSGRAFAMGPSRVDPRTGQILDADIIFDDSYLRYTFQDFDIFGPAAMVSSRGPAFESWVEQNADILPAALTAALSHEHATEDERLLDLAEKKLNQMGRCTCSYASDMRQHIAFMHQMLVATGRGDKKIPERLIGEVIQQIVTHEVGHTLGLRHNFKGSAWLTMDEIKQKRDQTDEPFVASVMDYTSPLFFVGDDIQSVRHFFSPTIGPYDEFAIQYGYAFPKGQSEDAMLKDIAKRGAERPLRYSTDEDISWSFTPDPEAARFDYSSSPVDWASSRVELAGSLMKNIREWALRDGDPKYLLRDAFDTVWWTQCNSPSGVAPLVIGQYFSRDCKGDPNEKPALALVDPKLRREGLKYIAETVFNTDFWAVDPDLLNELVPPRWDTESGDPPLRLDYPIHERAYRVQLFMLVDLLAPPVLEQLYDAELKATGDDKYTVAEHLQTIRDFVWKELEQRRDGPFTDADPFISSIARGGQRAYLRLMLLIAQSSPGAAMPPDLYAMVRMSLRELNDRIDRALQTKKLDFASRAHLVECQSRIERTMQAPFEGS